MTTRNYSIFLNPNILVSLAFLSVLILYLFQWSDLLLPLHPGLVSFLVLFIFANFFWGLACQCSGVYKYVSIDSPKKNKSMFILGIGGILFSAIYGYIATLHVIIVAFSSFLAILACNNYLLARRKRKRWLLLHLVLLALIFFVIGHRIFLFFILLAVFLLIVQNKMNDMKKLRIRNVLSFLCLGLAILFVFGFVGNRIRSEIFHAGDLILVIGEANERFTESGIPNEFFWAYIYATSPMANLNLNIRLNNREGYSIRNFYIFIISTFFPDFLSRRILSPEIYFESRRGKQINDILNVFSIFLVPYRYFSWVGMFITFLFITFFPFVYFSIIRNTPNFLIYLVVFNIIYVFLVFDNLLAFSGLSFMLFFPLLGIIFRSKYLKYQG